jgi:hypothetical protein
MDCYNRGIYYTSLGKRALTESAGAALALFFIIHTVTPPKTTPPVHYGKSISHRALFGYLVD